MGYQTFPEFMHNDEVSGFWILNKPQMYSSAVVVAILLVLTKPLGLVTQVATSVIVGFLVGFTAGSKIKGISGYIYAYSWVKFYFRVLLLRNTSIFAATLSRESNIERTDPGRTVVNGSQTSLPRIDRSGQM